jgi:Uma2 family endonuclease
MTALVQDSQLLKRLIAQRKADGSDRWDEVWDGVDLLTPLPDDEHQELVGGLVSVLNVTVGFPGLAKVRPGVNISDRDDWTKNYRCPDVAVFLPDTAAENRETYWYGGPDFAVEVVSEGDRSREKLGFYAAVSTRELLLVDRDPWALELFRLAGDRLESVGRSTVEQPDRLASAALPLTFRLVGGAERPRIEIVHPDGRTWAI